MIQSYHSKNLPQGSRIGIYGTGKRGIIEKNSIEQCRKDIEIIFFLDSFSRGEIDGYKVLKPEDLKGNQNNLDLILICSVYFVDITMHLVELGFPDSKIAISATDDDFFPRACLISKKYSFIFIPIGKAASGSFLKIFSDYCPDGVQNIDYRASEYKDYFKFAFVRNPFDRFVSCFSIVLVLPLFKSFFSYLAGKTNYTFKDMLETIVNIKDGASHPAWASQSLTLCDSNDKILVDSIYKLEHLPEALAEIEEKLGIKLNMPHLHASRHSNYKEYYTSFEKEMCSKHYARDLQNFSYNFNGEDDLILGRDVEPDLRK